MRLLNSLKDVQIGDLIGLKFKNRERQHQKEVANWVGVAEVKNKFEETDNKSARKYKTGEVYRIYKKVLFKMETVNKFNRFWKYLGIRNEWSKKFECCVDYNKRSWEMYMLETEKDKMEILKEIMADGLEYDEDKMELEYYPSFLSSPWLDYQS